MPYLPQRSLELLRLGTGNPDAKFHQGQEQAIQHIMEGRGRLLVVQKTGWGKSFVYFIATKLLREQGEGPALLISPLIALMRNQIHSAAKVNVLAVSFNYTNKEEWDANVAAIAANRVDIIIISPEQLDKEYFKNKVLTIIADHVSLLVIEYFIKTAFPTRVEVSQILEALDGAPDGLSIRELEKVVNISNGRIDKALLLLSLESPSPIAKQDSKWQLTSANLNESFWARAERLTKLREYEQSQMQEYVDLKDGHMAFLIKALDGDPGRIRPPQLPLLPITVDPRILEAAIAFLRRTNLPIKPRELWPSGGLPHYKLKGHIPTELQAQPGKSLCYWRDAGWGKLVYQGKDIDHHFSDELVGACVNLIREWNILPAPEWVTCIPSLRHKELVPDFAQRLSAALGIPFCPVLVKTEERPEQKKMENSSQQARNVDGALAINVKSPPKGPVLLVDDMVDSKWTMTIATWLLRSHGSGEVWPLALALTGHE